jgi:hypothetical protein
MKTLKMQSIEYNDSEGRDIDEILRDAYRRTGLQYKAAALVGVSRQTYSKWIKQRNIDLDSIEVDLENRRY